MSKKMLLVPFLILVLVMAAFLIASRLNRPTSTKDFGNGFYKNIETLNFDEANSYLVLVDKNNRLQSNFSPSDLVLLNVLDYSQNPNTIIYMRQEAAEMVEQLFQAAAGEAGLILLGRSGYRSYETQVQVYERYVEEHGQEEADLFSARPGHSEHQTGLALDVTAHSVNGQLVQEFGETPEGQWLKDNAHRFGFIISYPEGREAETGYMYEPWHIRFVGIEPASKIYENDWLLAQYLKTRG